jgi:hypothetical protein
MLHARKCLYIGGEGKERGVRPRLLDWLISIQFVTENGGKIFLEKSGAYLYHYITPQYRKKRN